jgi:hypothetical protein
MARARVGHDPRPMALLRRLTTALFSVMLAALAVGLAASLAVTSDALGAGTASTPRCTTAGLTVFQNLSVANVASVTVATLPAACATATLQVTVNNGITTGSGSTTVPAGGGSVTVTLAVAVAATAAETTDIVLVGP